MSEGVPCQSITLVEAKFFVDEILTKAARHSFSDSEDLRLLV
jgi:hypothetical protein